MLDATEGDHFAVARGQGCDRAVEIALRLFLLDALLAGDGKVVLKLRCDAGLGRVVASAFGGERQRRAPSAEQIDAVVAGDAQHPRSERLASIEIADPDVSPDESLLRRVARFLTRPEHPETEPVHGLLVLFHQPRECGLVAARGRARPLRLVGWTSRADQLGYGRQREGQRDCRVHWGFYGHREGVFHLRSNPFAGAGKRLPAPRAGMCRAPPARGSAGKEFYPSLQRVPARSGSRPKLPASGFPRASRRARATARQDEGRRASAPSAPRAARTARC